MEHSQTEQTAEESPFRSARFVIWLSWQELNGRKTVFFINVILVALLIALPVSLDLMGKARQSSVQSRIDYIGPSLILAPRGVLSSDLVTARFRGTTFPSALFNTVLRDLGGYLRRAEVRLTTRLPLAGVSAPVVGIDFQRVYSYPFSRFAPGRGEVLLGSLAAEKWQKREGETIRIESREFTVAGIIPTAGGIDDVSVFVPLEVLQKLAGLEERINEIRLFPGDRASYDDLKSRLHHYADRLSVIDAYRGDTAEEGIDATLLHYQQSLYTIAFILIALCIMISTYINLEGRKAEVSTVYTLGARQGIIFQLLTLRTIWITLLGSVIGQLTALFVTALQDYQVPMRAVWSTGSFIEVVIGTVCLGMAVTTPFALYLVYRGDPVEHL